MFPIVHVGPLAIQTPGLILLLGIWFGLLLAEKQAGNFQVNPAAIYNVVWISLVAGIVGARLLYIAEYPSAFSGNLGNIISLNPQLADLTGGYGFAILAAFIYIQRTHQPTWRLLDALTSLFAVMAIMIGLSNLASGNAFGMQSNLPWSIYLWGAWRHPSQIYETLAAIGIFGLTWPGHILGIGMSFDSLRIPGLRFCLFLSYTAFAILFLQAFRGDSNIIFGSLRAGQLLAWIILAINLFAIRRLVASSKPEQKAREMNG